MPDDATRWRCGVCGNLTRFDVLRSTRAREYVHVDLSGGQEVEDREIVSDVAESVSCRWCGSVDRVEVVPRPGAGRSDGAEGSVVPPP